jgi:hypothetical protein
MNLRSEDAAFIVKILTTSRAKGYFLTSAERKVLASGQIQFKYVLIWAYSTRDIDPKSNGDWIWLQKHIDKTIETKAGFQQVFQCLGQ